MTETSQNGAAVIQVRAIVVADNSARLSELVQTIRTEPDLQLAGTASTEHEVLPVVRNAQPDVVLVDETLNGRSTVPLIQTLAAEFPDVGVVAATDAENLDFLRQAMLSGARGFVTLPLDRDELADAVKQVYHVTFRQQPDRAPETPPPNGRHAPSGRVIGVYSPKGGVGKTTVATSLAIALHQRTDQRVAIIDTDPQFGHVGLAMNVQSSYSILDVTSSETLDPELALGMMPQHASGVHVLLAPPDIERPDALPAQHITELLRRLRSMFDWIVVDNWTTLTDTTVDVLDKADLVLLLVTPDLTVVRDIGRFLELAEALQLGKDSFKVILNRADAGHLEPAKVHEALGWEIFASIPDDEPAVTHSLNRGVPIIIGQKRSPVSRAIDDLARQLHALYVPVEPSGALNRFLQKLPFGGQ